MIERPAKNIKPDDTIFIGGVPNKVLRVEQYLRLVTDNVLNTLTVPEDFVVYTKRTPEPGDRVRRFCNVRGPGAEAVILRAGKNAVHYEVLVTHRGNGYFPKGTRVTWHVRCFEVIE